MNARIPTTTSGWFDRAWDLAAPIGLSWLGTLVVLVVLGLILSFITLRASRRVPTERSGRATGLDSALRKIYQVVLWLCCAFYYLSIPLILVVVVGAGGGAIYLFFSMGRIPVKLVLIIGAVVLVTVYAVLRSLFVRRVDADPGEKLDLSKHPKLHSVLEEVASRIGTRPVDNVYLTPGTEVAVFERGSMLKQMTRGSERCLVLGVAVLDGMKLSEFKAILAHEYGHFSNQDTAGGGFAIAVRRSLLTMAIGLARGGAATWYNPAWWFVNGFYRVFLRISQGASRLQEVLADRWAAFAYGSKAFISGLQHVIARSVKFDFHVQDTVGELVKANQPLTNLYSYRPSNPTNQQVISAMLEEAMEKRASAYDSHPAPRERFAWVEALGSKTQEPLTGEDPEVWSLFGDPEGIQRAMTELVRVNLAVNADIVLKGESTPASRAGGANP